MSLSPLDLPGTGCSARWGRACPCSAPSHGRDKGTLGPQQHPAVCSCGFQQDKRLMSHTGAWGPRAAQGQVPSGRRECGAKANAASRKLGVQLVPAPGSGEGEMPAPSWCSPNQGPRAELEGSWSEGRFGIALAQAAVLQLLLVAGLHIFPEPFPKGPAHEMAFPAAARVSGAGLMGCREQICLVQVPQLLSLQPRRSGRELSPQEPGGREGEGLCSRSPSCRSAQGRKVSFIPGDRLPAPGCLSPFTAC